MNAAHACRLAIAPRFRLSPDWPRRLALGAPWRPPTDGELAGLVRDPAPGPQDGAEVWLFALPRHLLDEWQGLLARAAARAGPLEGFDAFAGRVSAFLAFKELPVPPGSAFEVTVSGPGQASVCWGGLAGSRLWGVVNLGDEAASVVFAGLPDREGPPVRLRVEPGEGFRLPDHAPPVAGCTLDRREPDVFLLMRHPVPGR
jgi:hypothetical protein